MPSTPSPWKVYREALDPLKCGHALWEPSPIYSYRRVRLGDVGYIRRGRFHLLFSAGVPLGSRVPGTDVPPTFEPLNVGPTISNSARPPGYLHSNTVKQAGADARDSLAVARPVGPGVKMTFELTSKQGAALITNHPTYREDIERERERHFEIYTKKHFDSWVDFAREIGHGEDIKPVLVTGVDLTKEFSSIAYSDNRTHVECEFSVGAPAVGSASMPAWGSWSTPGLVHTNCGPTQGSAQRYRGTDESPFSGPVSVIPEDHNQCVFIRYYTIRKKLSIPLLLEAWAGPHQLPEENVEEDDAEVTVVEISDDGDEEIGYLIEAGSNVIHNVPLDDRDGFNVVAEFIFQRSNATSVLLHHRDIQDFLKESEEETIRFLEESEVAKRIEIDENGVGQLIPKSPKENQSSNPVGESFDIIADPRVQSTQTEAVAPTDDQIQPNSPAESPDSLPSHACGTASDTNIIASDLRSVASENITTISDTMVATSTRSMPGGGSHFRRQLNDWLQVNGGTQRLGWKTIRVGPEHSPTWNVVCLIDDVEWSAASGSSLALAKEEAARKVIGYLKSMSTSSQEI